MTYNRNNRKEKADRIFNELNGEPVAPEETAGRTIDREYVPQEYKKVPVTFGFEIEQKKRDVGVGFSGEERYGYEWERDLSGPWECQMPGGAQGSMKYPGREVHGFIEEVKRLNSEWKWRGEFNGNGCGCHMHLGVRTNVEFPYNMTLKPYESWAVAYNTLVATVPFLKPIFAWGERTGPWAHRSSVNRWASDSKVRKSVSTCRSRAQNPYNFNNNKNQTVSFHPAERGVKPLTIEMRLNEGHVSTTYFGGIILNRVIRSCIERGYVSPKIKEATISTETVDRKEFLDRLSNVSKTSKHDISRDRTPNLYSHYNRYISDITFEEGREIPGCQESYSGSTAYTDLFQDIIRNYTPTFPPLARQGVFFSHLNNPRKGENGMKFWDIFAELGEFTWPDTEREYVEHG